MDPSRPNAVPWSSRELREMLEHQMTAPLASETERFAHLANCAPDHVANRLAHCPCPTFGDLLRHKAPPLDVLTMTKDFAKAAMADQDDLPRDVARVLYVLAILRGQSVPGGRLTALDDAVIVREARRCLAFGWLPDGIQGLLREGVKSLGRTRES
jgi:hypothetical protein